jgi:outer membrane lipoprotein SlyB
MLETLIPALAVSGSGKTFGGVGVKIFATFVATTLMITVAAGCATQQPVLYPNETLRTYGPARAERAIDDCVQLAQAHGVDSNQSDHVAGRTVSGGAVGAASGAAVGAVLGDAGTGAAAGAAGGASRGLVRGLFGAGEPDPVFRQFVDRCLREKGYEPIGWE